MAPCFPTYCIYIYIYIQVLYIYIRIYIYKNTHIYSYCVYCFLTKSVGRFTPELLGKLSGLRSLGELAGLESTSFQIRESCDHFSSQGVWLPVQVLDSKDL